MEHGPRGIFCNRTLNLSSVKAIGYDLDYTLVHYHVAEWEQCAYDHLQAELKAQGWPVADLTFDHHAVNLGLVVDTEFGNVLKANRFGYVTRAYHGTKPMSFDEQKRRYAGTLVDLRDRRFGFLNTLFSLSEGCMFMQLVDLHDAGRLPSVRSYGELYRGVRSTLDQVHATGRLKEQIVKAPERFVALDPELPLTLLDQQAAGKKLLLITNSEWSYGAAMLSFAIDRFLPKGKSWRDLFTLCFFGARKPDFFSVAMPTFELVDDTGLLRELRGPLKPGGLYFGGNAALVEKSLGIEGDDVLYVGDHIFTDVNLTKNLLQWRTALILRELEDELMAIAAFRPQQRELAALMAEKEQREAELAAFRLHELRRNAGYWKQCPMSEGELDGHIAGLRQKLRELDERITPLARESSALMNPRWGLLMRAGNDKSHLARQVERYADVYTSRVSNFVLQTPFDYLRAPRQSLPHDPF